MKPPRMNLLTFILLAPLLVLVPLVRAYRSSRGRARLAQWAAENGYTLLSAEPRSLLRGNFTHTSTKYKLVFDVTLRDPSGRDRRAYVHIRGWLSRQFHNDITVEWL